MMQRIILFAGSFLIRQLAFAQAIDNTASFRMIDADKYVRLDYENDFFTKTDFYYTQGILLEMVNPSYKKFPLSKLLLTTKNGAASYGISLEHDAYTPRSLTNDNILYGDRPFAAAVFLKTFSFSNNKNQRYRLTSSLSTGVIGPAAGGYVVQRTIHRWLHESAPKGWQYQIRNDAVINYEVGMEKNIAHPAQFLIVNGFANARAGSLNDKFSTGLVVLFGKMNSAITSVFAPTQTTVPGVEKFNVHLYLQPLINFVGYDATLQGGVFNRTSVYTISPADIRRITLQGNYGLVMMLHSLYLEYFESVLTKEFDTGQSHFWGGVRVGVKL